MRTVQLAAPRSLSILLGCLIVTFTCAAIGARASIQAGQFYLQLARPAWAPPGWLFGPVWSVLYLLMAVAAWRIGRNGLRRAAPALLLYLGQLVLNALWSWLFFGWHQGALAFTCIVALWLMIAATIRQFGRHERLAALLLWPYLGWVSFAGLLCFDIWRRNPALLGLA
ncbi:tryptophan-rich sensory protein [Janthinobacterium sp. HH01]|uniref:TspO/MBR family protein n=1 Tax=Janthinobacterium sp. HH01 TaxID=1198452 RepID=UPI0002AED0B0|nr:TspO/MBR family protein [Janthinobacterium sp. HH01]ELX08440.1 tryptophan-rich sensory protein [Janthinobacterium sp. HH01]